MFDIENEGIKLTWSLLYLRPISITWTAKVQIMNIDTRLLRLKNTIKTFTSSFKVHLEKQSCTLLHHQEKIFLALQLIFCSAEETKIQP